MRSTAATSALLFVTNANKICVVVDDAYILIREELSNLNELRPLWQAVVQTGTPLVTSREDSKGEGLATLGRQPSARGLQVAAVRLSGLGDRRKANAQTSPC